MFTKIVNRAHEVKEKCLSVERKVLTLNKTYSSKGRPFYLQLHKPYLTDSGVFRRYNGYHINLQEKILRAQELVKGKLLLELNID